MCVTPLISSFLIFSILFIPIIHLNILISVLSSKSCSAFLSAQVSLPYIRTGLMTVLYTSHTIKIHYYVQIRRELRLLEAVLSKPHFLNLIMTGFQTVHSYIALLHNIDPHTWLNSIKHPQINLMMTAVICSQNSTGGGIPSLSLHRHIKTIAIFSKNLHSFQNYIFHPESIIIIIIRQPLCPVVGRRPQHAVSKLPCLVLSSAISCRSSICPGRLSIAWLVSLVVFSCHMVSNW